MDEPKPKIKEIDLDIILAESRSAIQDFGLAKLVAEAKTKKFDLLSEESQEMLCAGMIQLGEALTFCRDRRVPAVKNSGIFSSAIALANIRNYFIHHHMYQHFLRQYDDFGKYFGELKVTIETVSKYLLGLEEKAQQTQAKTLLKEVVPGKNKFKFRYPVFLGCLQNEFRLLNEAMEKIKPEEELTTYKKIFLNNRVRNIFSVMLDMTKDNPKNINEGEEDETCEKLKTLVEGFNAQFVLENEDFFDFFENLKTNRNALCHLDPVLPQPYRDDDSKQIIAFVKSRLQELNVRGYLEGLEKTCMAAQEFANTLPSNKDQMFSGREVYAGGEKRERVSPEKNMPFVTQSKALGMLAVYNTSGAKKKTEDEDQDAASKAGEQSAEKKQKASSSSSSFSKGRK